jgi:DNA-directed RNA polymerase sigma subunit (sigma70/sigma32)
MPDIRIRTSCGDGFFDESEAYDGERSNKPRSFEETGANLTVHPWYGPLPTPDEQADLLRAAKAGDGRAKDQLVRFHHRQVLSIAQEDPVKAEDHNFGDLSIPDFLRRPING